MDAGLAAVCGALAGAAATIGASFAAGWWQRENARIAVRAEHRKERRAPRYEAYRAFVSAAAGMAEAARDGDTDPAAMENFRALSNELKTQWLEVSLLGPKHVLTSARAVHSKALDIEECLRRASVLGVNEDGETEESRQRITDQYYSNARDLNDAANAVYSALTIFAESAQKAMDDDGSRRGGI
ncbi:hypothetical protein ACFU6R_19870 [Streptomyces sp. NPDC057499]|uniref:hypothetical protein n=1 Tax=Streptomyces sp. NPDC057499 TaxID=3346150 RepID=UPI0036A3B97C